MDLVEMIIEELGERVQDNEDRYGVTEVNWDSDSVDIYSETGWKLVIQLVLVGEEVKCECHCEQRLPKNIDYAKRIVKELDNTVLCSIYDDYEGAAETLFNTIFGEESCSQ